MTAQLILPETHYVTGGEMAPFGSTEHPFGKSPRIWWWPVDGEWEQNDSVGLHGTDEFGPPADLVKLTEPCDTCHGDGECSNCLPTRHPITGELDYTIGKRIVQLVRVCDTCGGDGAVDRLFGAACRGCSSFPYGPEGPPVSDGTVPVARVTITLLGPALDAEGYDDRSPLPHVLAFSEPHDGHLTWIRWEPGTFTPLPFNVEPGQWVLRAEEILSDENDDLDPQFPAPSSCPESERRD